MRVVFIGTGDLAIPSFRWLLGAPGIETVALITQPDKPVGRHQTEMQSPAIKKLALERGVRVLQPVKMRAPEAVGEVQALGADLIVVMAYGQILPKGVLDAAKVACLNLHASLLPRWRGAAPIQAAIEAGDEKTGITTMRSAPSACTSATDSAARIFTGCNTRTPRSIARRLITGACNS